MSGDDLDRAIDAAVREILGTEPPAGLRQRVFRRLSEPERRPLFTPRRLAVVAAVALVAVLGTVVARRDRTAPVTGVPAGPALARQVESAPTPTPAPPGAATGGPASAAHRPVTRTAVARRDTTGQRMVSATSLTDDDNLVVVAPLDSLRQIDSAPVGGGAVELPGLVVAPLVLEPLPVDPLSSPPR